MKFVPINCKTHFSLLKAFSKPKKLVEKCVEYGYEACGLADIKTVSGAVQFHQACIKKGIKPIIGCDYGDYTLYAKNKAGWIDLMMYTTSYNINPDLNKLKKIGANGNIICVSYNEMYKKIFGKNFYRLNIDKWATYYASKEESVLHRVLLCSEMKTTLPKVYNKIKKGESVENLEFFTSDGFSLPNKPDCSEAELEMLNRIFRACEVYEISERPKLPKFDCPKGYTEDEYLKELCRQGWKRLLVEGDKVS